MAKKTTKKAATKTRKKSAKAAVKVPHGYAGHHKSGCEKCSTNDTVLKTIFVVLGIAVVVAAYYVGFLFGSGMGGVNINNVNELRVVMTQNGISATTADAVIATLQASEKNTRSDSGNLVITEYSDFECPFCQRFYADAYQQIRSTYGDDIEFVYKHFPLTSIHPQAQKAAEASECARDQDMFWEYHDRLFETKQFSVANLKQHADTLGLDTNEFNDCLDSGEKADLVAADIAEGRAAGVSGTPSFVINGELIVGAQPFSVFQQKIDAALGGSAPAPAPSPAPTPTAAPVAVSEDDDAVKGDPNAPVTLIEFSDYECPFCGRHYAQTYDLIVENYIDTGKVKLVYRDFPLSFHPNAQKAAEAAECAGEQGMYWEMHDQLFENQGSLSVANYKAWAGEFGLNQAAFDECLDSGAMTQEVQADFAAGQAAGVTGTPGFFVNGVKISGAQPYSVFEAAFEAALAEQ